MSIHYGPEYSTDGLVLSIDVANIRSNRGMKNLLNVSQWVAGTTGSASDWSRNGTIAENQRIIATNPVGIDSVVWDTPSNDVESNDDGGWAVGNFDIDPTFYYRFSTWIRRPTVGNGSYYLGLYGLAANGTNMGVITRSDGVTNDTNPYFLASGWGYGAGNWVLMIGHVHPIGSGSGAAHVDSGMWYANGTYIGGATDYIWRDGNENVKAQHRSYLYYSTDTATNQQWWNPRIDKLDGTQPSRLELLAGAGGTLLDLSKKCTIQCANGIENSFQTVSQNPPVYVMDGTTSKKWIQISGLYNFSSSGKFTLSIWVKSTDTVWNNTGCIWSRRNQFIIHPNSGSTTINWYVNTAGGWEAVTTFPTNIDSWNHYVMTYNAGSLKAYTNGVLSQDGSVNASLTSDTGIACIGKDDEQPDRWLNGQFSMAQAWNRDLSAAEISRLYNSTRARHGR